ncbi:phage portal protein [Lysobacter arvi]|uniref:Phage portal protein n=1 Tax=Lysobacter arvi TaxID=3038776 RepID=A0ABU1CDA6_9GAMM|nr:phage portal protein [Lysobacter arvi]MDR0182394.1 phage portal protein [Lysobacter arvi]
MSRHRKRRTATAATRTETAPPSRAEVFTFGDPTPVLDRRELFEYLECARMDRWYEPPISFDGLSKIFRSSPHHSSAIYVKRNILVSTFVPHRLLSREAFSRLALDYLVFANCYLERRDSIGGTALRLEPALAKYTRRGIEDGRYFFVRGWRDVHEFERDRVWHLLEPDINQEIYGLPEYLSALQSALLNESATLFRRRYYLNGSHAGFILYVNDQAQNIGDVDAMRAALKESKGVGNFKNLFLYSPGGKKDGVQVIPISEVAAKDEFLGIKNASRDDILAAHRVPPQLMGILPNNTGGFGDVVKAAQVFVANELRPLQARFESLNQWIGEEVVRFGDYAPQSSAAA